MPPRWPRRRSRGGRAAGRGGRAAGRGGCAEGLGAGGDEQHSASTAEADRCEGLGRVELRAALRRHCFELAV
jgi:hypothetical protein